MKPSLIFILSLFLLSFEAFAQETNKFGLPEFDLEDKTVIDTVKTLLRRPAYLDFYFTMDEDESNKILDQLTEDDLKLDFGENIVLNLCDPLIDSIFGLYDISFVANDLDANKLINWMNTINRLTIEKGYDDLVLIDFKMDSFFNTLDDLNEGYTLTPVKYFASKAQSDKKDMSRYLKLSVEKISNSHQFNLYLSISSLFLEIEIQKAEKAKVLNKLKF